MPDPAGLAWIGQHDRDTSDLTHHEIVAAILARLRGAAPALVAESIDVQENSFGLLGTAHDVMHDISEPE